MYILPFPSKNINAEVKTMTSKELLYIDDALGHEQYFQTKCCEVIDQLQDRELKTAVQQMQQTHQQIYQNFFSLLG